MSDVSQQSEIELAFAEVGVAMHITGDGIKLENQRRRSIGAESSLDAGGLNDLEPQRRKSAGQMLSSSRRQRKGKTGNLECLVTRSDHGPHRKFSSQETLSTGHTSLTSFCSASRDSQDSLEGGSCSSNEFYDISSRHSQQKSSSSLAEEHDDSSQGLNNNNSGHSRQKSSGDLDSSGGEEGNKMMKTLQRLESKVDQLEEKIDRRRTKRTSGSGRLKTEMSKSRLKAAFYAQSSPPSDGARRTQRRDSMSTPGIEEGSQRPNRRPSMSSRTEQREQASQRLQRRASMSTGGVQEGSQRPRRTKSGFDNEGSRRPRRTKSGFQEDHCTLSHTSSEGSRRPRRTTSVVDEGEVSRRPRRTKSGFQEEGSRRPRRSGSIERPQVPPRNNSGLDFEDMTDYGHASTGQVSRRPRRTKSGFQEEGSRRSRRSGSIERPQEPPRNNSGLGYEDMIDYGHASTGLVRNNSGLGYGDMTDYGHASMGQLNMNRQRRSSMSNRNSTGQLNNPQRRQRRRGSVDTGNQEMYHRSSTHTGIAERSRGLSRRASMSTGVEQETRRLQRTNSGHGNAGVRGHQRPRRTKSGFEDEGTRRQRRTKSGLEDPSVFEEEVSRRGPRRTKSGFQDEGSRRPRRTKSGIEDQPPSGNSGLGYESMAACGHASMGKINLNAPRTGSARRRSMY